MRLYFLIDRQTILDHGCSFFFINDISSPLDGKKLLYIDDPKFFVRLVPWLIVLRFRGTKCEYLGGVSTIDLV